VGIDAFYVGQQHGNMIVRISGTIEPHWLQIGQPIAQALDESHFLLVDAFDASLYDVTDSR